MKKMENYKLSKIYKIISNQTNNIYIGSTKRKYLSDRMANHRSDYKLYEKKKRHYVSSFEILKYDDVKIILIENYPCNSKDELRAREQYWIDQNKDICINKIHAVMNKENRKKYYKEYIKRTEYKKRRKICIYCDLNILSDHFSRHLKSNNHKENYKYFQDILNNV